MAEKFEGWAVLELMGHRRLAGYVREVELAGQGMLRLDIADETPATDGESVGYAAVATQFYSPGAVYALTPCTQEAALAVARRTFVKPPALLGLPAPVTVETKPYGLRECVCGHVEAAHEHVKYDNEDESYICRIEGCGCEHFDEADNEDEVPF